MTTMYASGMKLDQQLSAKQMAAVSGLGGLVAVTGFLLPSPRHMAAPHPYYPFWVSAVLMFGLLIVGIGISLAAESSLKKGVRNKRWSEDEIVSLQAVLESPLWVVSGVACLIGSGVMMATMPESRDIPWALVLAVQSVGRLSMSIRSGRPEPPSWQLWDRPSPLRSEHWGER